MTAKRVIYVSGPMSGRENANREAFEAAAKYLSTLPGVQEVWIPHDIAPHEHEGECPPSYTHNLDHSAACFLREDLVAMLIKCTEVWMLPGWEHSVGARLELQVATACGMPIYFLVNELRVLWATARPTINRAYQLLVDVGLVDLPKVVSKPPLFGDGWCSDDHPRNPDNEEHCLVVDCGNYAGRFV